jgi:hypothetical protein
LLIVASSALAQTVVPITSEPDHHLVISNDYVRVFRVEVPAKAETLYHQHDYDYLYVALGDADVTSTRLNEKPVSVLLKDGEVEFSKGPFAHKAMNNSDLPFRNVTIEIFGGIGTPICGIAGGKKSCGGFGGGAVGVVATSLNRAGADSPSRFPGWSYGGSFILQASKLTVARVDFNGKADLDLAQIAHGPYLLIPVSDVALTCNSRNRTEALSALAGKPVWISEQNVNMRNLSDSAKLIVIGFSPAETQ